MKTYQEALDYAIRLREDVDVMCDTGSGHEDPYHGPYHVIRFAFDHYHNVCNWKTVARVRMTVNVEELHHVQPPVVEPTVESVAYYSPDRQGQRPDPPRYF